MSKTRAIFAFVLGLSSFPVEAPADPMGASVDCSTRDVEAVTAIEDHGVAGDVSPNRLYGASLILLEARRACENRRFEEAGALYEFVLSLGPVATTKLDK